jgi:repressor LexA
MKSGLGEKSMQVFRFVASYVDRKGYAPSYRQIAAGCRLRSTSNVAYHLDRLVVAGWLKREPGVAHAIVVLKEWERE